MKKIKNTSIVNKITLLALALIILTNPWSAGYIGYGVELLATYFVLYSTYGFMAGLALAVGLMIYFMYSTRDKVNIPKAKSTRKI
jgi:hypothetical protein